MKNRVPPAWMLAIAFCFMGSAQASPAPKVRIEGTAAWITYLNRGSAQDVAGKKDVSWLESAVLLKEAGIWRKQFFHSTRVPVPVK